VLYLAEVQKQKGGLLSGGKAELKLLACQRNDQSWSSITEEVITAEEASKLNDGAMVMVELSPQRQVQRIQEAGKPLVNILQNYSRLVEKFKAKEEEIDQWKESLTFQAQELSRRELEMEDRMAQLQQLEEECQNLDSQQQAVDSSRAEFERLTEEIERNRQELEGAWEHLRGEQRRLEENQAEYQQGTFVDAARAALLRELLDRLANGVPATAVGEHLGFAVEMTDMQQELLNPHWQKFQLRKTEVEQQQVEIEGLLEEFAEIQNELEISETALDHQTSELKDNIAKLNSKQEYVVILRGYLRYQEDMYQQMYSLAAMSGSVALDESFDIEAFESMPLEELEQTVRDLQDKLSIDSSFVNDQELELKYKQETIEDLKQKISQTTDSDRALYEEELKDEKDLYQMLNETLVGQRRNLLQRQDQLRAHQTVLLRRQGKGLTSEQQENQADLIPILAQIESQRRQQSDELQSLEREIEQIQASIDLTQGMIESQIQEMGEKRQELRVKEENLQLFQTAQAESKAILEFYEETLQPIQDSVDGLRQKLQGVSDSLTLVQESGNSQHEAVNEMREVLMSFIAQPELATS
jgi:chromosome segregation ATPase